MIMLQNKKGRLAKMTSLPLAGVKYAGAVATHLKRISSPVPVNYGFHSELKVISTKFLAKFPIMRYIFIQTIVNLLAYT